jgi:hypothetical protein
MAGDAEAAVLAALARAQREPDPYPHCNLSSVLPDSVAAAIAELPAGSEGVGETGGRRETHNASRVFLTSTGSCSGPECRMVAEAFQSNAVVTALARTTGADLAGASLRIEYCLDRDGFWLEPHTDIGAKRFTMLIYLSRGPGSADWGTDIYRSDGSLHGRASAIFNSALVFVPAHDTWHGFARRPIAGVRRSLIVNYVGPEWRARHELAFPDEPIRLEGAP